jgi:hypothetical protein
MFEAWLFEFLWSPFDCRSGQALDAGAWSFISMRSGNGCHHAGLSMYHLMADLIKRFAETDGLRIGD